MKKIIDSILFFPSITKFKILSLLGITIASACFEGFGVAMLFPVMDFIEKGKDFNALAGTSKMWSYMKRFFELFSIPKTLISLMIIVFILLIVRQLFNYLRMVYSAWITESILDDIRTNGFKWFVKADLPFYDKHGVGQLINVLTVDGIRTGGGIFSFFNLLSASTIFILYFIFIMMLSPGMTLFALSIMACVGIILKSRITRSGEIGNKVSEYNERISSAIVERLNGIRFIKVSATEEKEIDLIRNLSQRIKLSKYDLSRIRARMEFMVDPMVVLAGLIILYVSVEIFHMSLARTGIFIFVLLRLMPYTKDIFNSRQALAGFSGSLFRVKEMLDAGKDAFVIKGGKIKNITLEKGIKFENVSFYYNVEEGYVLKDINIFLPAGKMTALVGRSGAGKSTLVDLIPRLRVPAEGKITMDDILIEEFDIKALRQSIAFVSQEGFLFNDTIENNIRYSRPEASKQEIVEAAEMAYADNFIREFPLGYQTVVGEKGLKLSGGQKQRIILARALLQRAKIIILDEPTSALDSESEQYIQKAIAEIMATKKITMIIIAHRLSTIKSADQIIVLDKGRILEIGNHITLISKDSLYGEMVKLQAI